MSRPIKFRGRCKDTQEWVYGSLINYKNEDYWNRFFIKEELDRLTFSEMPNAKNIYSVLCVEVIPETVGQFTGLLDKNGTEIYEGDIVVGYGTWNLIVSIEKGHTVIKWTDYDLSKQCVYLEREWINGEEAVVIGNIHDNNEIK